MRLKRARNSLSSISTRVPPQILGSIFSWNVIPEHDFGGLRKGSYNFLLVCRHWFEVASGTPELWSFWGNTLKQWLQRYQRSGTAPLDLVLDGYCRDTLYIPSNGLPQLLRALRDRVASDSIRSVHFDCPETQAIRSVISSLIPSGEGIRPSSIESIILYGIDCSDLFAHYHFSRLRYLHLPSSAETRIQLWDHLGLHTGALTTLSLDFTDTSSTPTPSQLLSILASNPQLRSLDIIELLIPYRNVDEPMFRVPLRHLKKLRSNADFCFLSQLLHRLDLPETLDETTLTFYCDCPVEEVSGFLGPYIRDHLRRDGRFRDGLEISVISLADTIEIEVGTTSGTNGTNLPPPDRPRFASFTAVFKDALPLDAQDKLCIDFLTCTPMESVICSSGKLITRPLEQIIAAMPNIQELYLENVEMSEGFLQPASDGPLATTKLLPSLRHLHLEGPLMEMDRGDWGPLVSYLTHQTSGNQVISLTITGVYVHICSHMVEDVKSLVGELILYPIPDEKCPLGICQRDEEDGGDKGDGGPEDWWTKMFGSG